MPIDPAQGFPTDPTDALRARVIELERRLRENPGAQAGGGLVTDLVAVPYVGLTLAQLIAQGGPKVTLTVPEPGALVQVYGEADVRLDSLAGGMTAANYLWGEVFVVDDVYMNGDTNEGVVSNAGHFASQVSLGPNPGGGAFRRVRTADQVIDNTRSYGVQGTGAGQLAAAWAKPGARTFYLGVAWNGQGAPASNAGTVWQFKNRRLFARVVQ